MQKIISEHFVASGSGSAAGIVFPNNPHIRTNSFESQSRECPDCFGRETDAHGSLCKSCNGFTQISVSGGDDHPLPDARAGRAILSEKTNSDADTHRRAPTNSEAA